MCSKSIVSLVLLAVFAVLLADFGFFLVDGKEDLVANVLVPSTILSTTVTSFALLMAYLPVMGIWSLLSYAVRSALCLCPLKPVGRRRERRSIEQIQRSLCAHIVVVIGFSLLLFFFIGAYLGEYSLLALLAFAVSARFVAGNPLEWATRILPPYYLSGRASGT